MSSYYDDIINNKCIKRVLVDHMINPQKTKNEHTHTSVIENYKKIKKSIDLK